VPETRANTLPAVLEAYVAATTRLEQTHAVLQEEVARLRAELAGKDRELETRRRLAALGELAAGVAPEVRNPLGAIQLYSGLLRDECARQQVEPALQLLDKIEAGIQAIEAVVQDTLALAPRTRQRVACDLAATMQRAAEAVARVLAERRLALAVALPDGCVCVEADARGLQRVLINLLTNAAEASPAGARVELRAAVTDDSVTVSVLDQGQGLPDEFRHRIFDPFFTTKADGTGLGLSIAHRLVEAYGGRLAAANRPTGGAEFTITLHVAPPTSADAEPIATPHFTAA
jgi:signal transduction histidine kinase